LELRFNLQAYPSSPPPKWRVAKANTVQLTLRCFDLLDISVTKWLWRSRADLSLIREADGVVVRLEGPEVQVSARVEFVSVAEMSAYIHG
jgi:hypothetical protein